MHTQTEESINITFSQVLISITLISQDAHIYIFLTKKKKKKDKVMQVEKSEIHAHVPDDPP
jgi:hypothetical protein